MLGTIKRLFSASVFLLLCSVSSLYVGSLKAAAAAPKTADNILAQQLGADPGDGWMLAGGFLLLVALAFAFAGAMLWMKERNEG
jgi:hypothetical protein